MATEVKEGSSLSRSDIEQAFVRLDIHTESRSRLSPGCGSSSRSITKQNTDIHGLKQAARQWCLLLSSKQEGFDVEKSLSDPCGSILFDKSCGETSKVVAIAYLDNWVVAGKEGVVEEVKEHLDVFFPTKNLGESSYLNSRLLFKDCKRGL